MIENTLLIVIPGFGPPHTEEKLRILHKNIQRIYHWFQRYDHSLSSSSSSLTPCQIPFPWNIKKVLWWIRVYDESIRHLFEYFQKEWNSSFFPFCHVEFFVQPGHLAPFLRDSLLPSSLLPLFSHLMILLDDVEFHPNVDLHHCLYLLKTYQWDVISPALHSDSVSCHAFMKRGRESQKSLFLTNFLECFGLLFTLEGWTKYHSLIPKENQFLWGIDLLMYPYGEMKMGLIGYMHIRHHFSSKFDQSPFYSQMTKELSHLSRKFPKNLKFRFKVLQTFESVAEIPESLPWYNQTP